MNTVKLLKKSNSPSLPKMSSSDKKRDVSAYIATLLLGSLIGTYLDLYFVGIGVYEFPLRPFGEVFSVNIGFTLGGLPLFTFLFLYLSNKMNALNRIVFILTIGLLAAVMEQVAESVGLFSHEEEWKHGYSFIGYSVYLIVVRSFYRWIGR